MVGTQNPTLSIGSIFQGGYEILSELGMGSFGRVYRARQLSTGQEVAIKILRFREGDSSANVQNQIDRFRREMRLAAGLSHPNIVRLIDSGESDEGVLYAVFEYVPGSTLKEVLAAEGKLSMHDTVHLMSQVLDALSCAHARGVVHRDLKPENIMVTQTGVRRNALLLDLGLGGFAREAEEWALPRLTATRELMGTPCYAAPEQLRGESPTTRSDLYSWGLIFLECLTGELAVSGASGQEVVLKQLGPEPIPIPAWLCHQRLGRLLKTVTAKSVEKRDVTIEGLLETLDRLAQQGLQAAPGSGDAERLPEGEHRQLTVVCCRLAVSSPTGKTVDLEELDHLLHAQHAIFAERASRNGGQLASVLADRVLLVFGYPQAREDDARRAARTALQIAAAVQRWNARRETGCTIRLELRVGIHTGLVIVRELRQASSPGLFDVVGLTPQVAAQLVERAQPDEILVSADTHRLLRNQIGCTPAGTHQLSGFPASVPVFRLTGDPKPVSWVETLLPTHETTLVGRAQELSRLLDSWAHTEAGSGGAVLISGDSGMGKSRLVRELRRRVPENAWLECRCMAENQDSPLRPIVDMLTAVREPLESLLARHGFDVAETLPLLAALLSVPLEDRYAPLHLTPEREKELTLNALVTLLLKMAEERPRVFVIEDLHWADPTTLELAALLVQDVGTTQLGDPGAVPRICLVFTARPEFTPSWSVADMSLISLSRLTRQEVEEMVSAGVASGTPLPAALLEQVVSRADGVPLFAEEVTRVLIESGVLSQPVDQLTVDEPNLEIPTSLRDLLTARLDGLSPAAKESSQLAAVLGREFRYELLRVISHKDESALREDLAELTKAGLVYPRRGARSESYVFKHSLVRDAAYESMMRSVRQRIHKRIGETLRQRFPDIEQNRPELLALHFEKSAEILAAAEYWHRAGDRTRKRAAYVEAIRQLERGLQLLQHVPDSPERTRLQIALLTELGTALFSTKGYAGENVEETFAQAWELCERVGGDIPIKVLWGIWSARIACGNREGADKLIPRFERLVADAEDPVRTVVAHTALGTNAFWRGNFVEAREHLEPGRQLCGTDAVERFAREYGYDPGLYSYAFDTFTLWQLGYPDQAEALRREMLSVAESSGNPYSISLALGFGLTLLCERGDWEAALEMSERLIALSTEQRLYFWLAPAACGRGGALLQRGDTDDAIAQVTQGLELYKAIGVLSSYSVYLTYLAAAYLAAGQASDGLAVVDEGLRLCETHLARFHESELLRLKGDLLLLGEDVVAAEACLRQALAVAQRQQGKSYTLRAATSLGRLLRAQGKPADARMLVSGIYDWFTEGFDTRDLQAARALISELA